MDLSQRIYKFEINNKYLEITFSNRFKFLLDMNHLSLQKSMTNKQHFIIRDNYFFLELDYNLNENYKKCDIDKFMLNMCKFVSDE